MRGTEIVALGNAGMMVAHEGGRILFDPFVRGLPGFVSPREAGAHPLTASDLVLVTHDHWDHFDADEAAEAVGASGAAVMGPRRIVAKLKGRVPAASLVELEPPSSPWGSAPASLVARKAGVAVTAFRTFHGHGHNSYLVERPGLRVLHDGDNERTQGYDRALLAGLDALMLCPWQGAGWVEFIEAVKPRHWLLIHLSREEMGQHERGEFFQGLCDRLPQEPVALRPGERIKMEARERTP